MNASAICFLHNLPRDLLPLSPCGRGCRADVVREAGEGFASNKSKLPLTRLALAALRRATLSQNKGRGFRSQPRAVRSPSHREHRQARERIAALAGDGEPVLLIEANGACIV